MTEMSCRWWPIWYLLFFCHGAEGQLQWIVKEKVTDYGQNLTLFCPVGNCCSEPPGWFVGPNTIILDVRTFSNDPKVKYHGTFDTDGFGVVIRNLSEADLNVTYRCIYGFNQSTPKYLFHDDVFKENVPDKDKDKDEENNTVTILLIAVPIVVIILVGCMITAYCVYRSRIKKKRKKLRDTDVEMVPLNDTENQQVTDEEREVLNDSDNQMENRQGSSGHDILTRRAREGVDALEKNKIILLTGIDGIGKTFTAKQIIELYLKKHPEFELLDQSNLRRLQVKLEINYFPPGKFETNDKLIVFMDDFLANHYVKYLKEDLYILKMVCNTKREYPGTVEVVLTVEDSCIEWCKKELEQCGLLSEVYLIDLNEEIDKTEDLQEQLLKVYLPGEDHRDIVEKYRRAQEPKIGFPELCYLFSKNKIFRDQGADFFQDPSNSLNEYFMKLGSHMSSEEENVFYMALDIFQEKVHTYRL